MRYMAPEKQLAQLTMDPDASNPQATLSQKNENMKKTCNILAHLQLSLIVLKFISASFFLEMLKALHRTRRGGYNSRFGDVTQRYMHLKKKPPPL